MVSFLVFEDPRRAWVSQNIETVGGWGIPETFEEWNIPIELS